MGGQNIYFECRKKASAFNEALKSREKAAELLGVSTSSLADYELGLRKMVPPDIVIKMSDLYNAPELRNQYCKGECPLGHNIPMVTEDRGIEKATIQLINRMDDDTVRNIKQTLLRIAEDGNLSTDEQSDFDLIMEQLETIATQISALKIIADKRR